jgi:hypothetical protein
MATKHIERRLLVSVGICAALLIIVASIFVLDRATMEHIHDMAIALPFELIVFLKILGEPTPYVIVSSFVLLFCGIVYLNTGFSFSEFRIPARAFFIILAAISPWLIAKILEISFGRPLPGLYLAGGIYAFHPFKAGTDFASFPSEHAAVATAAQIRRILSAPDRSRHSFMLAASVRRARCRGVHGPSLRSAPAGCR